MLSSIQGLTDWSDWLPHLEFAYNNSSHAGKTPFYLNHGYHPRTPLDILTNASLQDVRNASAADFVATLKDADSAARDSLHHAQQQQVKFNSQARATRLFCVGDSVLLSAKHIPTRFRAKNAHKLQSPWLGPFQISRVLSPAVCELALPQGWRIHPVFNVALLKSITHL